MFTITATTTYIVAFSSFIFLSEHLGRKYMKFLIETKQKNILFVRTKQVWFLDCWRQRSEVPTSWPYLFFLFPLFSQGAPVPCYQPWQCTCRWSAHQWLMSGCSLLILVLGSSRHECEVFLAPDNLFVILFENWFFLCLSCDLAPFLLRVVFRSGLSDHQLFAQFPVGRFLFRSSVGVLLVLHLSYISCIVVFTVKLLLPSVWALMCFSIWVPHTKWNDIILLTPQKQKNMWTDQDSMFKKLQAWSILNFRCCVFSVSAHFYHPQLIALLWSGPIAVARNQDWSI